MKNMASDKIPTYKTELANLQKMLVVTQVDKDSSGIAFVCKSIAHKLTKRFIYSPNPKKTGLFEQDPRPINVVVSDLCTYSKRRFVKPMSDSLPQFKIIMKMHKAD